MVTLKKIDKEEFEKISNELNNDPEVKKFVNFYDFSSTYGILLNNNIVGLFSLYPFIDNNVVIHIAILKEFRNKGIGGIALDEIVEKYGELFLNSKYFMLDINYENEKAKNTAKKNNWKRTYEYDEIMEAEGAEVFDLYVKKNPCYGEEKEHII